MIALLIVSLAQAEARMGFLLQLYDPAGYVQGTLQVNLKGSEGTTRRLDAADDGSAPDIQSGDHIYTAPVPSFADGSVQIDMRSGSRTWRAEVTIPDDEKALVRLRLDPDGTAMPIGEVTTSRPTLTPGNTSSYPVGASGTSQPIPTGTRPIGQQMGQGQPLGQGLSPGQMAPGMGNAPMSMPGQAASTTATEEDLQAGMIVWAAGFVSLGAALGVVLALHGRRAAAAARLALDPLAVQPPRRLAAEDVDAALLGPLRPYRVVVLGPPLPGTIPCEDAAPLPDELVTAIERMATTAGGPPALLVTDPARIDPPHSGDPLTALAARVGGRFPVWVVGGPTAWSSWSPPRVAPVETLTEPAPPAPGEDPPSDEGIVAVPADDDAPRAAAR